MSSIIRATTTSGLQVAPDNSGSLQLQTNGTTTALTIDTSQNVGIGTTSPTQRLQVDSTGATSTVFSRNGGTNANTNVQFKNSTTSFYLGTNTSGNFSIKYNDPDLATSPNMVIDSSGNVGIGTTSPTTLLSFPATVGTAGDANRISLYTSGNNIYGFGISSGQLNIRAGDSGNIVFFTSTAGTATERMRIDSSGNLLFNSGYGSVATAYGCRAWVNFNGTGTVAIRGSGNVTSITDNATGDYTVNFTTAMPDTNYAFTGTGSAGGAMNAGNLAYNWDSNTKTTSALRVYTVSTSYTAVDANQANVAVFR